MSIGCACRCLKHSVPLEKVYTKTHREKFQWAIDMTTKDYAFDKFDDDEKRHKHKKAKKEQSDDDEDDDENTADDD